MKPAAPVLAAMLLVPLVTTLHAAESTAADVPASLAPPKHVGRPRPEPAATNRAVQGIPSVAVAPRGRLRATWCAGVTPAEDQNNSAVLSTCGEGGQTWKEALILGPDGQQTPGGLIRIIYDYSRTGDRHILLATVREEDAAAGKVPGKDGRLRQLVGKASGGRGKKAAPARLRALPEADEPDARLHADGQGWRLDKAKVTDPKRPRVLLVGDSILNGYLKAVITRLEGKAYVDAWVNPYHQSKHVNRLLAEVLAHGPYDVVHFNMGLHGWQKGRIKEGTFEPLTRAYVQVIKDRLPRATIIWASSTPVTAKDRAGELFPEINDVIVEHNRLAAKVMKEMGVPVNDFYALLAPRLGLARGDQFHWKSEAYRLLADQAAASIRRALSQ